MDKEKEIGEIFRESLEGYQAEPSAELWGAIAQDKTLVRFNRRHKMVRIAKFAVVPVIATVAIVTALLLSNGKGDNTLAVASDTDTVVPTATTITTTTTVTAPATETAAPIVNTPQPVRNQTSIYPTQTTDNQKEKIESSTVPATVTKPVETAEPLMASEFAPTRNTTLPEIEEVHRSLPVPNRNNNHKKELDRSDAVVADQLPTSSDIQVEPKAGRSGQLTFSKDTSVCRNSNLTLYVYNALDVHWNIGVQGETVTICPDEPTLISATVTTYEKIDTTIYIHVGVFNCGLWIPTAFTPNGDGLNDEFLVQAPAEITRYECTIYDRSRGMLFRTTNIHQGWDGTFNGKPLPFGTYSYIITYFDEAGVKHVEKGQITLIR